MELDPQVSPEEIIAGRWSWAAKVGLLSLRVVPQQQCNGHCPCDSAQHIVETAVAQPRSERGATFFSCTGGVLEWLLINFGHTHTA